MVPAAAGRAPTRRGERGAELGAEGAADANTVVVRRDRAVRELSLQLAAVRGQRDQLDARGAELDGRLGGAPSPTALRDELTVINDLQLRLDEAAVEVRRARDANRRAGAEATKAEDRISAAWRSFDAARDAVARLAPPAGQPR